MPSTVNFSPPDALAIQRPKLLRVPETSKPRIAQVTPGAYFESRYFPTERWAEMEVFCPEMLMGSAADLYWLVEKVGQNEITLSSVDHAVFVLTTAGDAPANDVLRVTLWQTFGVPVYELFVGADGTVLAGECEAHEGWHVEPGCRFYKANENELMADSRHIKGIRTGLSGAIENERCVCGRFGARVTNVFQRKGTRNRLRLAAIA